MGVIFEFILSVIIGPIVGFTLRLFAFIVLDILFDGIRHAVLFIRYGWKYKKQLDASYSDSGILPQVSQDVPTVFLGQWDKLVSCRFMCFICTTPEMVKQMKQLIQSCPKLPRLPHLFFWGSGTKMLLHSAPLFHVLFCGALEQNCPTLFQLFRIHIVE